MTAAGESVSSYRDAIRWGLLIAAVAVTGYRLPKAFGDFREWRFASQVDPSAAAFYRMEFWVDIIGIAVVLCVGVGVFYLLRSPARDRR
jgi:hypothetical protein